MIKMGILIAIVAAIIYFNLDENPGGCDFKCFNCPFPECSEKDKERHMRP